MENKKQKTKTGQMNTVQELPKWKTDCEEFEAEANDRLESFLQTLQDDDRFVFSIENAGEDSEYGLHLSEGFTFIYTRRGQKLAKEMIRRLYKLGRKYFPDGYIDLSSWLYKEL